MIYITAIRMSNGGTRPSHITDLRWEEAGTTSHGDVTKQTLVDWIDSGNVAKVENKYGVDPLLVTIHPHARPAYVQTQPNDTTADNLLGLPRF